MLRCAMATQSAFCNVKVRHVGLCAMRHTVHAHARKRTGARAWSTMHFYFNNHKDSMLKCTASPEIRWCFTGLNCCAN